MPEYQSIDYVVVKQSAQRWMLALKESNDISENFDDAFYSL